MRERETRKEKTNARNSKYMCPVHLFPSLSLSPSNTLKHQNTHTTHALNSHIEWRGSHKRISSGRRIHESVLLLLGLTRTLSSLREIHICAFELSQEFTDTLIVRVGVAFTAGEIVTTGRVHHHITVIRGGGRSDIGGGKKSGEETEEEKRENKGALHLSIDSGTRVTHTVRPTWRASVDMSGGSFKSLHMLTTDRQSPNLIGQISDSTLSI